MTHLFFKKEALPVQCQFPQDGGWGKKSSRDIKGFVFYTILLWTAKIVLCWKSLRTNKEAT